MPRFLDLAVRTILIGYATGLRSQTGPAMVIAARRAGSLPRRLRSIDRALAHPAAHAITATAMMGEFIGDKLPSTPSRAQAGPAFGRLVGGGLAGALLAATLDAPRRGRASVMATVIGAILAAVGAAGGTWLGVRARLDATEAVTSVTSGRPETSGRVGPIAVALAEDGLAVALAAAATHGIRRR